MPIGPVIITNENKYKSEGRNNVYTLSVNLFFSGNAKPQKKNDTETGKGEYTTTPKALVLCRI